MLEISYSTLSSLDSGVSTLSTSNQAEFHLRSRAAGPAPARPATVAYPTVASAPNLRSAAFLRRGSPNSPPENVHFVNGALNIELKGLEKPSEREKIVLRVTADDRRVTASDSDENGDSSSDDQRTSSANRRASVYMNVPGHGEAVHVHNDSVHVHGDKADLQQSTVHDVESTPVVHQYVNVSQELVQRSK